MFYYNLAVFLIAIALGVSAFRARSFLVDKQQVQTEPWSTSGTGLGMKVMQTEELLTIQPAPLTNTTMEIPAYVEILAVYTTVKEAIPGASRFSVSGAGRTLIVNASTKINATANSAGASTSTGSSPTAITLTPNTQPTNNSGKVRIIIMWALHSGT